MVKKKLILNKKDYERLNEIILRSGGESKNPNLRDLRGELDSADVVTPEKIPSDYITMNSKVRFIDIESGDSFTYTLVYPSDADSANGKLSILAPIGTALIGNRVGDVITWHVPAGEKKFKIDKLLYQPEANGDYDL